MSLINTTVLPFQARAYHKGQFVSVSPADLASHWSVFFFYPADFSRLCPTELTDLADHYAQFEQLGVQLYAVSTDKELTHQAWHDTHPGIGRIEFPMVADPTGTITRNFQVMDELTGSSQRATFIISPQLKIVAYEIHARNFGRNADELVRKIQAAQFVDENQGALCPAHWRPGNSVIK